jgi:hypothetical protein
MTKLVEREFDKFRGYGNKPLTEGLFIESCNDKQTALYTLGVRDRRVAGVFYPSLHKLYVEMEDVAEYNFATLYFESYSHWLKIKTLALFKDVYAAMVGELNAKLRGVAINVMIEQVKSGEANQSTLKYLADNDYLPKASKGRPTKEAVDKEVRKQTGVKLAINNDLERIKRL